MTSRKSKLRRLQRIVDALRHFIKNKRDWDLVELALAVDAHFSLTKRERTRLRKEIRMARLSRSDAQKLRRKREREVGAGGPNWTAALRAMRKKEALRRRGIW